MARRTIGELIRTRWIAGGEMVDSDLLLSVGRYEEDLLRRRPDLVGWQRRPSSLPFDLVIWVPAGVALPGPGDISLGKEKDDPYYRG